MALMFNPKILGSKVEMFKIEWTVQNYVENQFSGPRQVGCDLARRVVTRQRKGGGGGGGGGVGRGIG